jgi:hypothetical protein
MAVRIEILRRRTVPVILENANLSPKVRKAHVPPSLGDTDTFCKAIPSEIRDDLGHDLWYLHRILA